MSLSIEGYDALERDALTRIGYAEHAAFSTKTFEHFGFPTRMRLERELIRYADFFVGMTMERLEANRFFTDTPVETNYTMDEVILLNRIASAVGGITERACGKRIPVYYNHLSAVGVFRAVQAIVAAYGREHISVFEPGPGCGYLGALIGMMGHRYASYDVTQGYYVWQSRLHESLFKADFVDFAWEPFRDCTQPFPERIAHLPWWDFMRLHNRCPIAADIVISTANLGEMHPLGLKYMLRIAREMLKQSEIGLIVFGTTGQPHFGGAKYIDTELRAIGYEPVLTKKMFAYGPVGKARPTEMVAALEEHIPLYDPSGTGKTFAPKDFIKVDPERVSDEHRFYAFLDDWPHL